MALTFTSSILYIVIDKVLVRNHKKLVNNILQN